MYSTVELTPLKKIKVSRKNTLTLLSGSDRGNLESLELQNVINVPRCLETYEANAINQCAGTAVRTPFLSSFFFSPCFTHSAPLWSVLSFSLSFPSSSCMPSPSSPFSSSSLLAFSEDMSRTFVLISRCKIRRQVLCLDHPQESSW